jgi:hypothetical protein
MIKANGSAIRIELINMAECFRNVLSRFWSEARVIDLLSRLMPSAALRLSASSIGVLQKRDLQVTKIVTAKQTQFG